MSGTRQNPYVGTRPFRIDEGDLFFGRERESLDLLSLVISERLVLFYAQSGAGKSSLINTKLIPGLLAEGEFKVLPVGRVGGSEAISASDADNIYVYNLINSLLQHDVRRDVLSTLTLTEFLSGLEKEDDIGLKKVLVIDQFEELFSTHQEAWEKREDFFRQLAQAMQNNPYLWVVLVMREDYIAYLDPYAYLLPGKLRVRYYMQRLERDAALQAIKKPVENLRPYAEGVAEKLVENLAGIKVQKPNGDLEIRTGQFVEPVQLQVVCQNLWDHLSPGGTQITQSDLDGVGDVDQALERYYEERVSTVAKEQNVPEREIREWFEKELITIGRMRNMVLHGRKNSGGLDNAVIQALQGNLVRAELRAGQIWYELSHDRLIEPVLKSNEKWFSAHLNFFQQQAALWDERGRSDGLLLRRKELREAEAWAEANGGQLTDMEELFLAACREAREEAKEKILANRRLRTALRTSVIIAGIAVLLLGASVILGIQSYQNQRTMQMQALLGASSEALIKEEKELATRLAYQALVTYGDHIEAEEALGNIVHPIEKISTIKVPFTVSDSQTVVTSVSVSPDGKILASGESDGTVILWDLESYKVLGELPPLYNAIGSVAFSPDGKTMAAANYSTITLWNISDPTHPSEMPALTGHNDTVSTITFSQDGKTLASASFDTTIKLWNVSNPSFSSELATLSGHNEVVWGLAFSPDGKTLASGSWDDSVILWNIDDLNQASPIATLRKHSLDVEGVVFSPDGAILASTSDDSTIILWDVSTRQPLGDPITGHSGYVRYVAFSPDGRTLASQSDSGEIFLWDIVDPTAPRHLTAIQGISNVVFSPDGKELFAGSSDGAVLWDIRTPADPVQLQTLTKHEYTGVTSVTSMSLAADGKTLAIIGVDGSVALSDVASGELTPLSLEASDTGTVTSMALSPDGRYIALGRDDGSVSVWEAATGNPEARMLHDGLVSSVAFSPDGNYLVSGSYDGTARVWEIAAESEIARVKHRGSVVWVSSVAFSPDGKYAASAGDDDRTILVWEAHSGKKIARLAHENWVNSMAFDPDGMRLAIALDNGRTVQVWDLETKQPSFTVTDGELQTLNYSVAGLISLARQAEQKTDKNQENSEPADKQQENTPPESPSGVISIAYPRDGLFVLYQNGVRDQWTFWPRRSELEEYAKGLCKNCELTYDQRLEYELYTWPMQVFNYQGPLIVITNLLLYGLCLGIVYRSVFTKPGDRSHTQGFAWKNLLRASALGGILILFSGLAWVLTAFFEQIYYPEATRYPKDTIIWLLLLVLPLGLWAGGAYSHFTRLQSGKWSRRKRSAAGILAGMLSGALAGFVGTLVILYISQRFTLYIEDWGTSVIGGLIVGGAMGLMSLFGALIYIFWLHPWSERRRLRQQEEEDF